MPARRPALAALALAVLGLAAALASAPPSNAKTPWSVSASPMTLTAGVATDVTVTLNPKGIDIQCVTISMPANFTAVSTTVGNPPGSAWSGSFGTSRPTKVTFATQNGAARLKDVAGTFVIRVIATTSLLSTWTVAAYAKGNCTSSQGGPRLPLTAFVILPGLIPTPTPSPSPTPAPTPTPSPTPSARPSPSPGPSASPSPSPVRPRPSSGTGTSPAPSSSEPGTSPDPSAGDSPGSSPTPSSSPADSAPPTVGGGPVGQVGNGGSGGSGGSSGSGGSGGQLQVQPLPAGDSVQLNDFGALSSTALFAWLVPGAALTLPSLLIVLIVLAQAGFATAWVPVTRRVLGGGRRRRSRA